MDKKRKIKTVFTLCFVTVCGGMYLVFCNPFGKPAGIVFEKQADALLSGTGATDGEESSVLQEKGAGEDTEDPGGGRADTETPEALLYVHVCGAVLEEGVYALPSGSRVTDGIIAAGGFQEGADVTFHNLAALLTDGQKIYVPTLEETQALSLAERAESSLTGVTDAYGNGSEKKVNLNTAGLAELMTLSGIGEAKAESILKYREKVGRFQSIEELKKVSGIGDAMFERIQEEIVVE